MAKAQQVKSAAKKRKHSIMFTQNSLTKQSFKNETNINNIMDKYERQGIVDHINKYQGSYGDFTNIPDYQEALNQIERAKTMFNSLPSRVRKEFDNDPVKFVEFVQNPDNVEKLHEIGLAKAKPVSEAKASEAIQVDEKSKKEADKPSPAAESDNA